MRAWLSGIAALGLLGGTVPAHGERAPTVLEPSSKWVANYADDSCRLVRTFGQGERLTRLEFRLFKPGEYVWVLLSGPSLGKPIGGRIKVSYRFAPDSSDDRESFALGGTMDDKSAALIFPAWLLTADARSKAPPSKDREANERWLTDWSPEREAQIDAFEVSLPGKRVVLKIGNMKPPMDVMRDCLDNLVASWGMDVKVQKSLARPPVPATPPSNWLGLGDYPVAMLQSGYGDHVDFRLMVDATGKPTACDVLTMDSRPEFIKATCGPLMRRARFEPALDAGGHPVASVYVNSVTFVIG